MSEKFSRILRQRRTGNDIPSGRQLPRTPPMTDVKRILDFADPDMDFRTPQQNEESNPRSPRARNGSGPDPEAKTAGSHSMLKGMKGYQLTQSDLEFLKKMEEEKLIKKLQGDLREVQKLLKDETMALEQAHVSREKEQAELHKFPSRDQLSEWVRLVLQTTSPAADFADSDVKSLLAMVTVTDVQSVIAQKKKGLAQMRKSLSKKRKKEEEEQGKLEKETASQEMKIQGLMRELSELKSELSQREAAFEPPDQPKIPIMPQENPKAQNTKPKRRGRPKKEGADHAEGSEVKGDATKRTRPPNRTGGGAHKTQNQAPDKPQPLPEKRTRAKKVEEESGRGKPDEAAASRARNHGKTKAASRGAKGAGEEGQNVVLRRSKRIINQR